MNRFIRIKKEMPKKESIVLALIGIAIFISVWSALSYGGILEEYFLPTPTKTISSMATLFTEQGFLNDILISLYRILSGFALAIVIAFPIGILIGSFRFFQALIEPVVDFIRYIPPSAFIPLTIIWFGIGDIQKSFIIFLGIFPYLIILFADNVVKVPDEYLDTAKTLGANTVQILRRVIIPNSMPGFLDSIRVMLGAAWTFVIIAEMVAASSGLGFFIIQAQRFIQTPNIFATIIIIGFIGLGSDLILRYIYKKSFFWVGKSV